MVESPRPNGIKLHDLPGDILCTCLVIGNVASETDYVGLMLTNKALHKVLSDGPTLAAWLTARKGEQQAFELTALRLRRQDVFCSLLVIYQVKEASALQLQHYAQQRQQQQQQAMDTSPLHLACKAGFVKAVRRLLPQVCAFASVVCLHVCLCPLHKSVCTCVHHLVPGACPAVGSVRSHIFQAHYSEGQRRTKKTCCGYCCATKFPMHFIRICAKHAPVQRLCLPL